MKKTIITIGILVFLTIIFQKCNSSESKKASAPLHNDNPNKTAMLYKLYVVETKGPAIESQGIKLFNEFNKIYKSQNVEVIGVWTNEDNPNEVLFMTAFRDEGHYQSFITAMKDNRKYQEMSSLLEDERASIKGYNLKMPVNL